MTKAEALKLIESAPDDIEVTVTFGTRVELSAAERKRALAAQRASRYREKKRHAPSVIKRDAVTHPAEPVGTGFSPPHPLSSSHSLENNRPSESAPSLKETTTAVVVVRDASRVTEQPLIIPCPRDLQLTTDQRATLECALVPSWAIDRITSDFVSNFQADPNDRRTLVVWRKCLSRAVSGEWSDANKRRRLLDAQRDGMAPKPVKYIDQVQAERRATAGPKLPPPPEVLARVAQRGRATSPESSDRASPAPLAAPDDGDAFKPNLEASHG